MHEQSLVKSLLNQVQQLCRENNAVCVDVVTVEIGPLSGVEPELITSAFEQLAPLHLTPCPRLDIRLIDLAMRCRECTAESAAPAITFRCAVCSSSQVQIIRGDEFRLIDVAMQIPVYQDTSTFLPSNAARLES